MTTLALFSDIHANRHALEAVFADMETHESIDSLYCLGDLVGYAPWPNEVVELLRERRIPTIAGNYDEGVGLHSDDCGCAYPTEEDERRGAQSITFTNEVITEANRRYLRGLPRHLRLTFQPPRQQEAPPLNVLLVHGSPRRVNEYLYADRPDRSFLRLMDHADADVMAFGHTHKPFHKTLSPEEPNTPRHAVNIGSVGKPKDGDPRACYALLHLPDDFASGSIEVEFVRVEYDVARAASAIEESDLPNAFAQMLRDGG